MKALATLILALAFVADAANVYVRDGASGSGADWSDALDDLPASLTRGNTYYIADGAYAAYTFDDAISGTTLITIKKATVADHGTSTGWSDAYGDGQAQFGHGVTFSTGYYLFSGVSGSGLGTNDYGFQIMSTTPTLDHRFIALGTGTGVNPSFNTIEYVAMVAPTNDVEKQGVATHSQSYQTNTMIRHCLFVAMQNGISVRGLRMTNEHSIFVDGWSSSAHHGEQINFRKSGAQPCEDYVIRYNTFTNCTGTGVIVGNNASADELAATGAQIYGNLFDHCTSGGNGLITTTSAGYWQNISVFQNTFVSCSTLWFSDVQSSASAFIKANATGFWLSNNLCFDMSALIGDNADGTLNHDFNSFYDCTSVPTETNGQTGTGSPFNSTTDGMLTLATDTSARSALGGPHDTDATGTTFTSSRGWKQYGGGTTGPQNQPRGARVKGRWR